MAGVFVYKGMMDDMQRNGNGFNAGAYAEGSPNGFWLMLIENHPQLDDPVNGLGNYDVTTAADLLALANVAEINIPDPANGNGYYVPGPGQGGANGRLEITNAQREAVWAPTPNRMYLRYPNGTQSITLTWPNLATGATIGAFCLVRGDGSPDSNNNVWFSDSAATNLPFATNNINFTITMDQTAMIIIRQEGV